MLVNMSESSPWHQPLKTVYSTLTVEQQQAIRRVFMSQFRADAAAAAKQAAKQTAGTEDFSAWAVLLSNFSNEADKQECQPILDTMMDTLSQARIDSIVQLLAKLIVDTAQGKDFLKRSRLNLEESDRTDLAAVLDDLGDDAQKFVALFPGLKEDPALLVEIHQRGEAARKMEQHDSLPISPEIPALTPKLRRGTDWH